MEKEKKTKLNSRKFLVWVVATLFQCCSFVYAFISKDMELAKEMFPYWGWITMIYLGVNVGQKVGLAFAEKQSEEGEK